MQQLTQFAENTAGSSNVFTSLGIDWQNLVLQIVAFLLLVFILGKWVYPWLMKSVDDRQKKIDDANKAAAEASKSAEANKVEVAALLDQARKQANDIIATAKLESAATLNASEEKARKSADRIVADAQDQLNKDVANARKVLYNDTLDLVAMATEKIIHKKLDTKADSELIAESVKSSSKVAG